MVSIIGTFGARASVCGHRCSLSSFPTRLLRHRSSSLASASTARLPAALRRRCIFPVQCARRYTFTSMASVAADPPAEVMVKAATGEPDKLGDCPFSHRILLTLEEKKIPYSLKLVDLSNKPDWFLEINPEGKVPVIKHEGKWVPDSDVIAQIIEERYPEPSLQTPTKSGSPGSKVFPCFVKFLKSKDPSDGSEAALVAELKALNNHLESNGPYLTGDKIRALDLSLSPKLLHLKVALGHFKNWSIPSEFTCLLKYMEAMFSRESFMKTRVDDKSIIAGWQKHIQ